MVNIDSLIYSSLKNLKSNKKFTMFSNLNIIAPSHPFFACKELSSALSKYSKQIRYHKTGKMLRCASNLWKKNRQNVTDRAKKPSLKHIFHMLKWQHLLFILKWVLMKRIMSQVELPKHRRQGHEKIHEHEFH